MDLSCHKVGIDSQTKNDAVAMLTFSSYAIVAEWNC